MGNNMISSMTGYAHKSRVCAGGRLEVELRSVNSRYLDLHFRVSDELRGEEMALRTQIGRQIVRGKVECRLSFIAGRGAESGKINRALLEDLLHLQEEVLFTQADCPPLTVADILHWPGVVGEDSGAIKHDLSKDVRLLTEEALADFIVMRQREGEKLAAFIAERANALREIVERVAPLLPAIQEQFTGRLRQRLNDALGTVNDERILQEVTIFASRIDVAEELDRLRAHIDEVKCIVGKSEPCGKRLDFLMQELNREANTLGSKATNNELSRAAMDLKLVIEQIREQVQNLE